MNRENNQLITKSNVLIQETIDELDRKENQLMAILLAQFIADNSEARSSDEVTQPTTTVTLSEICNYLDLDIHSGFNTNSYKETIRHFQSRAFYTYIKDNNRASRRPMFDDIEFPAHWANETIPLTERNPEIKFTWHKNFIPMIICNSHFTALFKESILSLSLNAMKLYQLLKSYSNKDFDTTISVADLRVKLNMTTKAYDRFGNFYSRGIAKPLEEINAHTEINITAKKNLSKRDKRVVESITFHIKNTEKKRREWDYQFPKVALTPTEYEEIKNWQGSTGWKRCCIDLQKKLDEGVDIRNHYKWIVGHHNELMKKEEARQKQQAIDRQNGTISDEAFNDYFKHLQEQHGIY